MSQIVALGAVVVALSTAAAAFVAHARPDAALGLAARLNGLGAAWARGRLSYDDETRLIEQVRAVRWPLTALVFAQAFVAGACLAWARG